MAFYQVSLPLPLSTCIFNTAAGGHPFNTQVKSGYSSSKKSALTFPTHREEKPTSSPWPRGLCNQSLRPLIPSPHVLSLSQLHHTGQCAVTQTCASPPGPRTLVLALSWPWHSIPSEVLEPPWLT